MQAVEALEQAREEKQGFQTMLKGREKTIERLSVQIMKTWKADRRQPNLLDSMYPAFLDPRLI